MNIKTIKNRKKYLVSSVSFFAISFIIFFMLIPAAFAVPRTANAAGSSLADILKNGLVPCGKKTIPVDVPGANKGSTETTDIIDPKDLCTFDSVMKLVDNVITFILFGLSIPIAAIMFAYAGFQLVTAGSESAHARGQAKTIFTHAALGLIIAFAAFIIVKLLLSILGYKGDWIGF